MITVAIAVHNEENTIQKCLNLWQREPVDEILIISSASTDSTNKIIKDLKKDDQRINLIEETKKKGKPDAINKLLKTAKGEMIIMTDGDVLIEPGATNQLIKHLNNPKTGLVAGHVIPDNPKGMPGVWIKIAAEILHEKRSKNIELDVTGNLYAIRKGIIEEIPTNTTLDDVYVALKTRQKGYNIEYEPDAIVKVKGVTTIKDFIGQKTRTRIGWYQIKQTEKITTSRTPLKETRHIKKTLKYLITPIGLIAVPLYYILNIISWINAWYKFRTQKDYIKNWKPAKSSKI